MNRLPCLLFCALLLPAFSVHAQVKKCFKLLDQQEYAKALECFQNNKNSATEAVETGFGILKASAELKDRGLWMKAMGGYEKTLAAYDALDQKKQQTLAGAYNITKGNLEQAYKNVFVNALTWVETDKNALVFRDSFMNGVTVIPQAYRSRFNKLMIQQKNEPVSKRERVKPGAIGGKKPVYIERKAPEGSKLEFVRGINTEGSEYIPVLSADGKIMYFVGAERADNYAMEDIFYSQKQADGSWSEPKIEEFFSGPSNEAVVSMSADGNNLVLFISGKPHISTRTSTGWSEPAAILLQKPYAWIGMASITRNGEALIFEAKESVSSTINIFVALRKKNGNWDMPFDIGSPINTRMDERTPFLHSDFKTLYFSSTGHGGQGSFDVFKSTRLDDTWKNWSTPVNLGPNVNTAKNEFGFCIPPAGNVAYLATSIGFPDQDIMRIPLDSASRAEEQVVITGVLKDGRGQTLRGEITVEDAVTAKLLQTVTVRPDGAYSFSVPKTAKINYYATGDSLVSTKKTFVDVSTYKSEVAEEKVDIVTVKEVATEGKALELRDLLFDFAKSDLRTESQTELKRIYANIKSFNWAIEVGGHTDNVGSEQSNLQLSTRRAQAVRDFLVTQGYPADKITFKGYGSAVPMMENNSETGRARNRRVEIKVKN